MKTLLKALIDTIFGEAGRTIIRTWFLGAVICAVFALLCWAFGSP